LIGHACKSEDLPVTTPRIMLKRLLVIVFLSVFFVGLAAHVGIELCYSSSKLKISEPETGRVAQVTINHGKIVFVSQEELVRLHSIQTDGLLAMLVSFVGIRILKLSVKDMWH